MAKTYNIYTKALTINLMQVKANNKKEARTKAQKLIDNNNDESEIFEDIDMEIESIEEAKECENCGRPATQNMGEGFDRCNRCANL